jgi:hypothetical protein
VSWERRPIDPLPGPRRLDEIEGAEPLNRSVALASPDTRGPGGFRFAESHMARHLGEPTVLVDPHAGPRRLAADLDDAARRLGCDCVALVDVGGDVLAHGNEAGLASPLCDSILLAAAAHLELPAVGAVFGPACDGELTPAEVLERLAEVAAGGGMLGAHGITPAEATRLQDAVAQVPTEASAAAVLAARGVYGDHPIREGRRSVPLSPLSAVTFVFDPRTAIATAARLAAAVVDAPDLAAADRLLEGLGIRTEYAYERDMAR